MPNNRFHANQIYDAFEAFFSTDRNLNRTRCCTQYFFYLTDYFKEVGTRTVHLVYITDTRYIVFVCLTPNCLRLRFHTTYCTEGSYGTVQYTQRTFNFYREVHVPRSIDQIDFILIVLIVPESCRSSRSDGDTTFLLLFHPVHRCSTVVHFTNLVSQTSIEKNTFRCRSLSGIDMRHDTDVSGIFQLFVSFCCHDLILLRLIIIFRI